MKRLNNDKDHYMKKILIIPLIMIFYFCFGNKDNSIFKEIQIIDLKVENIKKVTINNDNQRKTLYEVQKEITIIESAVEELKEIDLPDSISIEVRDFYYNSLKLYNAYLFLAYFSAGNFDSVLESYKLINRDRPEITRIHFRGIVSQYLFKEINLDELLNEFSFYNSNYRDYEYYCFMAFVYLMDDDKKNFLSTINHENNYYKLPRLKNLLISHYDISNNNFIGAITKWQIIDDLLKQNPSMLWEDLFILDEEYIIKELENGQNEFLVCLLLKYVDEFERSMVYFDNYMDKYDFTSESDFQNIMSEKYEEDVVRTLMDYYNEVQNIREGNK